MIKKMNNIIMLIQTHMIDLVTIFPPKPKSIFICLHKLGNIYYNIFPFLYLDLDVSFLFKIHYLVTFIIISFPYYI